MIRPDEMYPPTFADWDVFWSLHLTSEYRAKIETDHNGPCETLAAFDELMDFLRALNVGGGDVTTPDVLNRSFASVASHLMSMHGFPILTLKERGDANASLQRCAMVLLGGVMVTIIQRAEDVFPEQNLN